MVQATGSELSVTKEDTVFLADSSPTDQRSHHQAHLVQLRLDQQHQGGPALATLHPRSPEAKAPRGSPALHADFRPAGCSLC